MRRLTPPIDFSGHIDQIRKRIERERHAAERLRRAEQALRDILEFEHTHPYQGYARAMARIARAALEAEEPENGTRRDANAR